MFHKISLTCGRWLNAGATFPQLRFLSGTTTATTLQSGDVDVTLENGVRTIKFNRPLKKNALTRDMSATIISNLEESNTDPATNLIVLTGEGDYFTSGIDLSSSRGPPNSEEPPRPPPTKRKALKFVTTLIDLRKPLIALVNGPAHGIGVTMLGLCDAVYCSDKATFTTKFTRFGLPPECCSTYTFPRIMGYAKANELLTFCNELSASDALASGLVSHVFPHDQFRTMAEDKVAQMASLPVQSLFYSKELIRGRERELLHQVHRAEQEKFDIGVALLVKQNFTIRKNM